MAFEPVDPTATFQETDDPAVSIYSDGSGRINSAGWDAFLPLGIEVALRVDRDRCLIGFDADPDPDEYTVTISETDGGVYTKQALRAVGVDFDALADEGTHRFSLEEDESGLVVFDATGLPGVDADTAVDQDEFDEEDADADDRASAGSETGAEHNEPSEAEPADTDGLANVSIDDVIHRTDGAGFQTERDLKDNGIETAADLAALSDNGLENIRGVGPAVRRRLRDVIESFRDETGEATDTTETTETSDTSEEDAQVIHVDPDENAFPPDGTREHQLEGMADHYETITAVADDIGVEREHAVRILAVRDLHERVDLEEFEVVLDA